MKNSPAKKPTDGKKLAVSRVLLALLLVACVGLSGGIYFYFVNYTEETFVYIPVTEIYCIAAGALVCAAVIINCGFSKDVPTRDALNPAWSDEKRDRFIASFPARKKAVKILAFITVCLAVPVLLDYIRLFLL